MFDFSLFVVVACVVLYVGKVNAGPIQRTNLPLDESSTLRSTSAFQAADVTLSSMGDNSPRDFVSSSAVTMDLYDHQTSQSVERRNPIFFELAVRNSATDASPSLPSSHPVPAPNSPQSESKSSLQKRIRELKDITFEKRVKFLQHQLEITYIFLGSLGAQYAAQKNSELVQPVIFKAKHVKQVSDTGSLKYPKDVQTAAEKLLKLYNGVYPREDKKLTPAEIQRQVITFAENMQANSVEAQAQEKKIEGLNVEMMDKEAQLWKLETQDMRRGDPGYNEARTNAAVASVFARVLSGSHWVPKAQVAANKFLDLLADTDKKLLVEDSDGRGKKEEVK
ncbi:hypothetical protein H0H93_009268 [Arthromyces matolae]|nr:hypothetical protein H0H93_009268 [Arthromyces matolae]